METTSPPTLGRRATIAVYIAAVFLFWAAQYLYIPTLPVYIQARTPDLALVGTILSMYGLWQAVARLPLGVWSDAVGQRKPFVFLGIALAAAGAYLMATASAPPLLLLGRSLTGLASATWVPMVVAFTSLYPPEDSVRASALITTASTVSMVAASLVNGPLNGLGGERLAFYASIGVAAAAALAMLPFREARRPASNISLAGIGRLVTRPDVLLPSLLSALSQYVVWAICFGFVPILGKSLGASTLAQSSLVTTYLVTATAGNLLAAALARRAGGRGITALSFALLAAGMLLAAFAGELLPLFACQALIGLGAGVNYPALMGLSIAGVREGEHNTAMGLYQSIYGVGMFAGPWLSGLLADRFGLPFMFAVTAGVVLLLGVAGSLRLQKQP